MHTTIIAWKNSLRILLDYYEAKRGSFYIFYPTLFLFFVLINITCYWWAMFTAFPELTRGIDGNHYFKVQFPVGLLGALFDSLSFFVTLYIIRRALTAEKDLEYVSHWRPSGCCMSSPLPAGWFIYLNQYDKICLVETRITEEC